MIRQIESNVFPREADLESVIEDGCMRTVRELMRRHGIFIACKSVDLPQQLGRYSFGKEFYLRAFGQFQRMALGVSLTGIRFTVKEMATVEAELKKLENKALSSRYRPKVLRLDPKNESGQIRAILSYDKLNPRYAAFGRRETIDIEVYVRELDSTTVEIAGTPKSNADSLIIRDFATAVLTKSTGNLLDVDIEILPVQSRVDLMDTLIRDRSDLPWRIEEVCGLSVRCSESDDEETEVADSDTQVLHSAILEGQRLREHPIVKELVQDRYYFCSATVWVYSSTRTEQLRLCVEFKKRPQVLVVSAVGARRMDTGNGDRWITVSVPEHAGDECARYFWDRVHQEFDTQRLQSKARAMQIQRKNIADPDNGGPQKISAASDQS